MFGEIVKKKSHNFITFLETNWSSIYAYIYKQTVPCNKGKTIMKRLESSQMLGLLSCCRNLPVDFLVYAHIKEENTPRFEDKREEYFRLNNRKKK